MPLPEASPVLHMSKGALRCLHAATEDWIVDAFVQIHLFAKHAKRATVTKHDMDMWTNVFQVAHIKLYRSQMSAAETKRHARRRTAPAMAKADGGEYIE